MKAFARNEVHARRRFLQRPLMLLAILPLATGIGLLTYIISGFALLAAVVLSGAMGAVAAWSVWRRADSKMRDEIRSRFVAGVATGALATLCYDLFRLGMVKFFHYTFWPFDIFAVFGRLLIGSGWSPVLTVTAGVSYHFANGIGFGVAHSFLFRRPSVWTGLAWAAVLELCMVSFYPGWLGLKAIDEFLNVSISSHVVYGVVLGFGTRRVLGPPAGSRVLSTGREVSLS